eukprot:4777416-Prymnesium_polylepis.1
MHWPFVFGFLCSLARAPMLGAGELLTQGEGRKKSHHFNPDCRKNLGVRMAVRGVKRALTTVVASQAALQVDTRRDFARPE